MLLTDVEQIQKRVGKLPAPRDLKVLNYIDEHAERWLSYSHFAFITCGKSGSLRLTAAGGEPSFVAVSDSKHITLPISAIDDGGIMKEGLSFGALFLVSGMEETLRVNGKVSKTDDGVASLIVEECYLHCAKAFKRSGFWLAESQQDSSDDISSFIKESSFLALATISSAGQADVSPKGDPVNFLIREEGGQVCFADRPGNRRIDSFRNIIEQPHVSLVALIPGGNNMLEINGTAELCVDGELLQQFAVQGKEPKLVTKITPSSIQLKTSKAIENSKLWFVKEAPADLVPAEIFKAHVKHSGDKSLQAKIARAAVSVPGAMKTGLEVDYKKNMY